MSEPVCRPPDVIDLAEHAWSGVMAESMAQIYALSTRILSVSHFVQVSFEADSQRLGLNSGELLVLDALFRLGAPYEASPAQLKSHFFISFAGIGKRLVRLEAQGLIERRINHADRRAQIVRLTDAGRSLLHQPTPDCEAPHVRAMERMTSEQQRRLAELLKTLHGNLEEEFARR